MYQKFKKEKMLNNFKNNAIEEIELRNKLRDEYKQKLITGEIIAPTRIDKLIKSANGHEDLQSTQTARRLLQKQGIDWKQENINNVPLDITVPIQNNNYGKNN